jgi:membrane-associated phospholipid phosphatase
MLAVLLAAPAGASIVSDWNGIALEEVRRSRFGPPIAARALAITHTCIYDAWASYDPNAVGAVVGSSLRRPSAEHTDANKATALSFAAYRCLLNLYPAGAGRLEAAMRSRGYNPADVSTDPATPQGLGNLVAQAVIDSRKDDGSNQYGTLSPGAYTDYTGYAPRNAPMPFCLPATQAPCPPNTADPLRWQPLISDTGTVQRFIAPHWGRVAPFALTSAQQFDAQTPVPNYLLGPARYAADVDQILAFSAALTEAQKLVVEYWADGPESELPPGHWGLFAQFVSQRDRHSIDQDAKLFFAMHQAAFDAGIVAWHLKRKFDGVRPITGIRNFKQGQQVLAWGGPGRPNQLVAGEKWSPYNPGSNLTPSFPGYISGHSTFSAASAEVLRLFTGSDAFGFSTVIAPDFGRVEPGVPRVPTTLSYSTFSAAVEEAGLSRLYAGIHFADDNTVGQDLGQRAGRQAWDKARFLFEGGLALRNTTSLVDSVERDEDKNWQLSFTHDVPDAANRLLLVGASFRKGKEGVEGVSYRGIPLRPLAQQRGPKDDNRVEIWYLVAPPPGTGEVEVQLPKNKKIVVGATTFVGVDQRSPFGIIRQASDDSQQACLTLANAPTSLVATVLATNGDAGSITNRSGQKSGWNAGTGTKKKEVRASGTTVQSRPLATLCQELESETPWSLIAVPLQPAVLP